MAWRVPVAISEKKHQCHVLSIFKALCYGNRCMFLCCVCLSISLVILNCWMISIKRGREAKVLELISFLQVSLKVTVWIERGNPTYSFRNSICSMHLTSLTRQEFTMGEIVFCFPVVGKMATGRHWICSHHLQQLQDCTFMLKEHGSWVGWAQWLCSVPVVKSAEWVLCLVLVIFDQGCCTWATYAL